MPSRQTFQRGRILLFVALMLTPTACGGASNDSTASLTVTREPSHEFLGKGPNGELANFGREATTEEREAASRVVEESLRDRENEDWAGQCDTLTSTYARQVAQSAPPGQLKTCSASIEAIAQGTKKGVLASTMTEPLAALRVEGTRAFAFYHGRAGKRYVIPLEMENGEWKLAALYELEIR